MTTLSPRFVALQDFASVLRADGHAALDAEAVCALARCEVLSLDALQPSWDDLPPDVYLRDNGRYRRRRHSCFMVESNEVTLAPHRAHWQPVEYNALHGGLERWFEPISQQVVTQPVWGRLLRALSATCSSLKGVQPWYVEAHQFRIDTTDGIGRPTPEGAHRDGVDFVAVILVSRVGVKGGETRVFEAHGAHGLRFTMTQPWTTLFLDDERVVHETTPIQPLAGGGHRDTLVLTFRAGGFQGKEPPTKAAQKAKRGRP